MEFRNTTYTAVNGNIIEQCTGQRKIDLGLRGTAEIYVQYTSEYERGTQGSWRAYIWQPRVGSGDIIASGEGKTAELAENAAYDNLTYGDQD